MIFYIILVGDKGEKEQQEHRGEGRGLAGDRGWVMPHTSTALCPQAWHCHPKRDKLQQS